jgi:chromosome segregation ATPase
MTDSGAQPLRRTWLRGYRTSDVEIALARVSLEAERLRHEVDAGRSRTQAMQTEINELHARIDGFRRREAELDRALEDVRRRREELDREAHARGEGIVAEAETRASALRTSTLKQVAELQSQLEQLLELRQNLIASLRRAGEGLDRALEQAGPPEPELRPADELAERLSRLTRDPEA